MLAAVFTAASTIEIRRNINEKNNYYNIIFVSCVWIDIM